MSQNLEIQIDGACNSVPVMSTEVDDKNQPLGFFQVLLRKFSQLEKLVVFHKAQNVRPLEKRVWEDIWSFAAEALFHSHGRFCLRIEGRSMHTQLDILGQQLHIKSTTRT